MIHSWKQWVLLVAVVLCACNPSGEVAQPEVELIELANADLRDMAFDHRWPVAPTCLYVTDAAQNQIHCVNVKTHEPDKSKAILVTRPVALALSRDETRLFVASEAQNGGSLLEVDPVSRLGSPPLKTFSGASPNAVAALFNGQVVVGLKGSDTQPASVDYWQPSSIQASAPYAGNGVRLIGAHNDGKLLMTVDEPSKNPIGYIWRTETNAPSLLKSGNYFGYIVQMFSSVAFHPVHHQFYVLTDGSVGALAIPGYSITENAITGSAAVDNLPIRIAANYPAVALAFTPDLRRVLVAHGTVPFDAYQPNHNLNVPDLHIFDADTGVETGIIALPYHVRDRGITVALDGTIYLLLGRDTASRIGVIRNPGN